MPTPSPQEVLTGPFLISHGIYYHQNTNQLVTGIVDRFHENGQLEERTNYIDGEPDGLSEWFHENGQLRTRGNFIDGERDGLSESFDRNGNLTSTRTYRNGEFIKENNNP